MFSLEILVIERSASAAVVSTSTPFTFEKSPAILVFDLPFQKVIVFFGPKKINDCY